MQLIVNGRKLGRKTMPKNGHLEWSTVYKPGYVRAIGYKGGRKVMDKRIETTGEAVEEVWTYETVGDVTIAKLEMRDAKGRFVPTACCELDFTAPEGTTILGWGNGDPAFRHIERPVKYGVSANCPDGTADKTSNGTPVPDHSARTIRITTFNGLAAVLLSAEK